MNREGKAANNCSSSRFTPRCPAALPKRFQEQKGHWKVRSLGLGGEVAGPHRPARHTLVLLCTNKHKA